MLARQSHSVATDDVEDILSVVDAAMETAPHSDADSFGRRFLLTDFSQIKIDRWSPTEVCSS